MPDIDDFHRDNSFLTTNDEFLQKHLFLKCIHRLGDKMIILTGEGINSIVRECYHLSNQIVNSWCTILIDFISAPTYHDTRRKRITRTDSKKKEERSVSLRSVNHLLDEQVDPSTNIDQLVQTSQTSAKRDYNTRSSPSKLDEIPENATNVHSFLFYPLFFLYPLFVRCLRFYMYLWSLILPDYAVHRREDIPSLSTSRLPSDIDVNSESISGLLEDLEVALFHIIHRCVQAIRICWLSLFNPQAYMSVSVWIVTTISYCAGCIRSFFSWLFHSSDHSKSLTIHRTERYQKWSDTRDQVNSLLQSYFGTLEACRPPTLFDSSKSEESSVLSPTAGLLTKSMLGYPLEEYSVHTVDHYCLVLFRIPRPETTRVVILQHGVMDTALAWISDKPSLSLAIQAYLQGYDVFFGSIRGTDGHYRSTRPRHEILDVKDTEYWDYRIDDFILDYRSFIQSIYVIKERERKKGQTERISGNTEFKAKYKGEIRTTAFRNLDESFLHEYYTIMGISHSMGGAITLAYIAESIMTHTAHHLSKVVLLSPAGYLADQSLIVKIVMACSPFVVTERSAPTAFPTRSSWAHLIIAKILQDMQSSPATLELVNQICAMVIGGDPQDWPFQKVNYTKYPLGVTSLYVMLQFRQWYQSDEFISYDYGEQGNMLRYGQKTPIRFTDYYDQFDLPVHFVAGKFDSIVPSTQVYRHFQKLSPILGKDTSYVEFKNAGHLQFTIGLDHDVISYVLDKLAEGNVQGYHGLKTEKLPPQCQFGFTKMDSAYRAYDCWIVCSNITPICNSTRACSHPTNTFISNHLSLVIYFFF